MPQYIFVESNATAAESLGILLGCTEIPCRNDAFWYPAASKNPVSVPYLFVSFLVHFQGSATRQ